MSDVLLFNYSVEIIIDDITTFYYCTDDINNAKEVFKAKLSNIDKIQYTIKQHIIIKLYDFDKNCNIEYYDNREERS